MEITLVYRAYGRTIKMFGVPLSYAFKVDNSLHMGQKKHKKILGLFLFNHKANALKRPKTFMKSKKYQLCLGLCILLVGKQFPKYFLCLIKLKSNFTNMLHYHFKQIDGPVKMQ